MILTDIEDIERFINEHYLYEDKRKYKLCLSDDIGFFAYKYSIVNVEHFSIYFDILTIDTATKTVTFRASLYDEKIVYSPTRECIIKNILG